MFSGVGAWRVAEPVAKFSCEMSVVAKAASVGNLAERLACAQQCPAPEKTALRLESERNLLSFLAQRNVTTLLVSVQHGLLGSVDEPTVAMSYLADTVILPRYYEHRGEVRRALSVFKKRRGAHERTIRDIEFSSRGIEIGPPLRQFLGILTGVPELQPELE